MGTFFSEIPGYCKNVLDLLNEAGYESYVVGGAVRDLLMGKTPSDFDVTTSAFPEETQAVLDKAGIKHIPTGIKHGTVMAVVEGKHLEITTFRVDGKYTDSRHPDAVGFTRSIEEDVARRDFTINAMYLDSDGNVKDIVGGMDDIEKGIIRTVGEPDVRFGEDALRILRGLRFASVTGFAFEEETALAMVRNAQLIRNISVERIMTEFNGLVVAPYASDVIRQSVKILSVIIPEIAKCKGFDQHTKYHDRDVLEHTLAVLDELPVEEDGNRDLELALAAVFHDIAKPDCFYLGESGIGHMKGHPAKSAMIADRFLEEYHYPSQVRKNVVKLISYHDYYPAETRKAIHRFLSNCRVDFAEKLFVLQKADILAHSPVGMKRMEQLEATVRIKKELEEAGEVFVIGDLKISGGDIVKSGVEPGPQVSLILNRIWDEYLDGNIPNDRTILLERISAFTMCS